MVLLAALPAVALMLVLAAGVTVAPGVAFRLTSLPGTVGRVCCGRMPALSAQTALFQSVNEIA